MSEMVCQYRSRQAVRSTLGFTLIELLIVLAILTLLAALLFPVFARARENARRTTCASNLKHIGFAALQYAQDHDEWVVGHRYGDSGWADVLQPYLKSLQILKCPSDDDKPTPKPDSNPPRLWRNAGVGPTYDGGPRDGEYCYGINIWNDTVAGGSQTRGPGGRALAVIQRPAQVILFADAHSASPDEINGGPLSIDIVRDQVDPNRHFKGADAFNAAFLDGHCKFTKVIDSTTPGPGGPGDNMWNALR